MGNGDISLIWHLITVKKVPSSFQNVCFRSVSFRRARLLDLWYLWVKPWGGPHWPKLPLPCLCACSYRWPSLMALNRWGIVSCALSERKFHVPKIREVSCSTCVNLHWIWEMNAFYSTSSCFVSWWLNDMQFLIQMATDIHWIPSAYTYNTCVHYV